MKALLIVLLAAFLVACTPPPPSETAVPSSVPASSEFIEFQSLTFPGHLWTPFMPPPEEGTATTVSGSLKIPASSGRIPAVILTHGCNSITSGELGWETRLNQMGIAIFLVHSLGSRHIPND